MYVHIRTAAARQLEGGEEGRGGQGRHSTKQITMIIIIITISIIIIISMIIIIIIIMIIIVSAIVSIIIIIIIIVLLSSDIETFPWEVKEQHGCSPLWAQVGSTRDFPHAR